MVSSFQECKLFHRLQRWCNRNISHFKCFSHFLLLKCCTVVGSGWLHWEGGREDNRRDETATRGRRETREVKGRTGKSCWPCISAWWHLAGANLSPKCKGGDLAGPGGGWLAGGAGGGLCLSALCHDMMSCHNSLRGTNELQ